MGVTLANHEAYEVGLAKLRSGAWVCDPDLGLFVDSKGRGIGWVGDDGYWRLRVRQRVLGVPVQRNLLLHRLLYMWCAERGSVPPIPSPGHVVDHVDNVQSHNWLSNLQAVTIQVNSTKEPGSRANRTHCPKGHEYTPENTYRTGANERQCRECRMLAHKRWYERQKVSR